MRERILAAIRECAAANGDRTPSMRRFARETGIRRGAWLGVYWTRWSDAVRDAGFEPNTLQLRMDDEVLLAKLAEACRHFGKFPTDIQLRMYKRADPSFPNVRTIGNHLGSLADAPRRVWEWAARSGDHADIMPILRAALSAPARPSARKEGLGYLIRSGAHCKIGRSDDLDRRFREISVTLPEAAVLVHTIRTDDPPGIEAYWHRRFAAKRARGEWFKLAPAEIAQFRRRRYQ